MTSGGDNLLRPGPGREVIDVDPERAGWRHLGFQLLDLHEGDRHELYGEGREIALLTLAGAGVVEVDGDAFPLSRSSVFAEMADLLYVPPGLRIELRAEGDWTVAVGSAPAEGRYPVRLITPAEMRVELRGGGAASRQVNHVLAAPLPAERLIVYELYVPGGSWAGWAPHCHDGLHGSPYLEETYFFMFDRPGGFGFHRNYVDDDSYDEVFAVRERDCVCVPRGFHVTTAVPGSNMWVLNFLAGELEDGARATPPYFDPRETWITEDWGGAQFSLPAVTPDATTEG
jgi:5-deoxy-glucuronate isomerase